MWCVYPQSTSTLRIYTELVDYAFSGRRRQDEENSHGRWLSRVHSWPSSVVLCGRFHSRSSLPTAHIALRMTSCVGTVCGLHYVASFRFMFSFSAWSSFHWFLRRLLQWYNHVHTNPSNVHMVCYRMYVVVVVAPSTATDKQHEMMNTQSITTRNVATKILEKKAWTEQQASERTQQRILTDVRYPPCESREERLDTRSKAQNIISREFILMFFGWTNHPLAPLNAWCFAVRQRIVRSAPPPPISPLPRWAKEIPTSTSSISNAVPDYVWSSVHAVTPMENSDRNERHAPNKKMQD